MEPSDPRPPSSANDPSPQAAGSGAGRAAGEGKQSLKGADKAAQLGLAGRVGASVPAAARRSNLPRALQLNKVMVLTLLAYLVVLCVVALWFHHRLMGGIEERLEAARGTAMAPPVAGGASASSSEAADADAPAAAAEVAKLKERLESDKAEARALVDGLGKRLADAEAAGRQQSARIEELTAALHAAKAAMDEMKAARPAPTPVAAPPAGEGLSPSQSELVLLKERNRLMGHADEAIATGARDPYEKLWEALDDPRLATLVHAARAEILRVQNYYLGGSRIDRYDIPVGTYFPEDAALRDSQLKDDQLMKLLRDQKNPWQVRMKAANLLGSRRTIESGDALAEAVMKDGNLDVVKEATFSFEQITGFRARIFDAASLNDWWKKYRAIPEPPPPKPKAAPAPAAKAEGRTTEPETKGEDAKAKPPAEGEGGAKTP